MPKGFVFSLKMNGVDISIDHLQQVPAQIIIKHIFQYMVAWPHLPGFQRREPCRFPASHHTGVATGVCSPLVLKAAIKSRKVKALAVSRQPAVTTKGLPLCSALPRKLAGLDPTHSSCPPGRNFHSNFNYRGPPAILHPLCLQVVEVAQDDNGPRRLWHPNGRSWVVVPAQGTAPHKPASNTNSEPKIMMIRTHNPSTWRYCHRFKASVG